MHYGASAFIFEKAQELRLRMTEYEKILWAELSNREKFPWKFRNQHPASKYILDFYCHKARLAIEVDGHYHESDMSKFYDDDRDRIMEEFGVKTIRFTNRQVLTQLNKVKTEIRSTILERLTQ